MFEFHLYESSLHGSPLSKSDEYRFFDNVSEMSLMFWGEHCIECAAPSCFASCDLYQARPDKRCRRLTFGMWRNEEFRSLRGYGAEVEFKRWGKLEARANFHMESVSSVVKKEKLVGAMLPIIDLAGKFLTRITGDIRWQSLSHSIVDRVAKWRFGRSSRGKRPDAFLLELVNPSVSPVNLQFRMTPARTDDDNRAHLVKLGTSFAATISVRPGYSVHQIDRQLFQKLLDQGDLFDISLTPEGDATLRLVILTADFVVFEKQDSGKSQLPNIKCVVWDLDNTLWDGILVEQEEVIPRAEIVTMIKALDGRGILMSVCSKNDFDRANDQLVKFGLADYMLYPQINWLPKSQNVRRIAELLNIGLDTFAFVDDNPFELDEVKQALPMVTCVPISDVQEISANPRFQGSSSKDARNRREYYRTAMLRDETQERYTDDFIGFLAHCAIRVTVKQYSEEDFERISDLVQRTNQLNFSGRKYGKAEVQHVISSEGYEKYVLGCSDRFGSYGIVGFCVVRHSKDEVSVDDFMLSCRVQGKFIEKAWFSHLSTHHNSKMARYLRVNFSETARNRPAKQILDTLGFVAGQGSGMVLDLSHGNLSCDFIRVDCTIESSTVRSDAG